MKPPQWRIIYRQWNNRDPNLRRFSRIESDIRTTPTADLARASIERDHRNEVLAVDEWTPALEKRVESIKVSVMKEDW